MDKVLYVERPENSHSPIFEPLTIVPKGFRRFDKGSTEGTKATIAICGGGAGY